MPAPFDEFLPFILIILSIILVGFLVVYFMLLRKLAKFKFKDVLQFRTNELTKITGKVLHANGPFIAPYSKRKCVAYVFEIKQKVKSGKSSHWKSLVKKEDIQDFFIEKKGEVVMIKPIENPKNYISYLVEDKSVSSGFMNDPSPEFKKLLNRYYIESENLLGFNKTLKYSERILEVGEIITVAGIAKWKVLNEPLEGYSYSKIATLESDNENKLIITDLPEAKQLKRQRI